MKRRDLLQKLLVASVLVAPLGSLAMAGTGCNLVLGLNDYTNECAAVAEGKPCPDAGLCTPGDTLDCYTGPDGTEGKGICQGGKKTCGNNGLFGACEGEVTPKAKEICGNGIDDTCKGKPDDGCPCTPGKKYTCFSGMTGMQDMGDCKSGTHVCQSDAKSYGPCTGEVLPKSENFDKKGDENCDGIPSADTLWSTR